MNTPEKDTKHGALAWMVSNPVAANLLMLFFVIGGLVVASTIRQEVMPPSELESVRISLVYQGANPDEIMRSLVIPIEQVIKDLENVDEITAQINPGAATITVMGIEGVDRDSLLKDVQNAVNTVRNLPSDAERPHVVLSGRVHEVLTLVLTGNENPEVLREWAEIIRTELALQPDITQVNLDGLQDREIQIEISQDALIQYNLTLAEVAATLRDSAVELGAGYMQTDQGDIFLRIDARKLTGADFARVPVRTGQDGRQLFLEDIATVTDGFAESRFKTEFNGQSTVLIDVYRVGSQSPTSVSTAAREVVEQYNTMLPGNLKINILFDDATDYNQRKDLLIRNAVMGFILVFLTLSLFLDPKLAFWVSLGIPISILGSFLFLKPLDISINMMTMFAFILTLGVVVDDAIVVGENIHTWRRRGYKRHDAAILGTREVVAPVTFSILTNMVAFVPLLLLPGMPGQLFGTLPYIVIAVFGCSLIESLFILPCHLAHGKPSVGFMARVAARQRHFSQRFTHWVHRVYAPLLRRMLTNRYAVLCACLALLFIGGAFYFSDRLGFELMPVAETDMAFVQVTMPTGSTRADLENVKNILVESAQQIIDENGGEKLSSGIFASLRPSSVQVRVYLTGADTRPLSTTTFTQLWRERAGTFPKAENIAFQSDRGGPGSGRGLTVRISHKDLTTLEESATALGEELLTFAQVRDVDTGMSRRTRQYDIVLLPAAAQFGLTAQDVASQVRAAFDGITILKMQRAADEVTVKLRLHTLERNNTQTLPSLRLRLPGGGQALLADIAIIKESVPYSTIRRVQGQQTLTIAADVLPRSESGRVKQAMDTDILPRLAAEFPGLSWSYGGMQRDIDKSMATLYTGLLCVLLAIYVLLAIPFKSYSQPLLIMFSIPFGMVGALIGHILLGYNLSVISLIGVLALCGIVVNDALVLIDFANKRIRIGIPPRQAIVEATTRRFRPVLLTTLTTFIGLMPMMLEQTYQAKQLIPVAISLGFGVLFATVITLALIPCLYLILEDCKKFLGITTLEQVASFAKTTGLEAED